MTHYPFDIKMVLPVVKRNSGCDFHRILNPMKYLDYDIESVPKQSTDEMLKDIKILYFNRAPENPFEKVIAFQKKFGFKTILDLDDYWILNVNHPMYSIWKKNKMGEEIVQWLKHADAVIVTTSRLADKVKLYNSNVYIIPNALPFDEDQFLNNKVESEFVRYIYTGGESHVWDIKLLKVPFLKLNNVPNAQFRLAGYSDKNPKIWDSMERTFTANGKIQNYERVYSKPLDSYMDVYSNADVSLIPLESNIFTPYKSNIKFLEAGCKNIPVICSNTPPYSDEPDQSVVMYARNVREWVHWIKYCHDNPNYVKESGQRLGEYVREHYNLRKVNEYRTQLFKQLMS